MSSLALKSYWHQLLLMTLILFLFVAKLLYSVKLILEGGMGEGRNLIEQKKVYVVLGAIGQLCFSLNSSFPVLPAQAFISKLIVVSDTEIFINPSKFE